MRRAGISAVPVAVAQRRGRALEGNRGRNDERAAFPTRIEGEDKSSRWFVVLPGRKRGENGRNLPFVQECEHAQVD